VNLSNFFVLFRQYSTSQPSDAILSDKECCKSFREWLKCEVHNSEVSTQYYINYPIYRR